MSRDHFRRAVASRRVTRWSPRWSFAAAAVLGLVTLLIASVVPTATARDSASVRSIDYDVAASTDDDRATPVLVDSTTGDRRGLRVGGDPASLGAATSVLVGAVAANGADDIIRLSTKDSWANLKTLDDHFARHGADFGAKSADDYASMASGFFQRGGAQQIPTKIAPDGTVRMFDPATNTFGAFAPNGMTKTFFKPTSPTYWSRQPGVLQ